MNELLITKYIPTTINDIIYNKHVIPDITSLIKIKNIHLLLVGKSGTGKSTFLSVIAKDCISHHPENEKNIFYINNLLELNILQCRTELKIFCQTRSLGTARKIVCIDDMDHLSEIHQLLISNYIDKYGGSIQFICSCSNKKKITDVLYSRLIRIHLKTVSFEDMRELFDLVCSNEKLLIEDTAKQFILHLCNGSFRNMISYLEKCLIMKSQIITLSISKKICTNIDYSTFKEYTQLCISGKLYNIHQSILIITKLFYSGYSVIDILDEYYIYIKYSELSDVQKYKIMEIITRYITLFYDGCENQIELALFTNNLMVALC